MRKNALLAIMAVCILLSCNDAQQKLNTAPEKETRSNTKVRNDIKLQAKGLKVSQAFLLYEDGRLVPANNEVEVGQPVRMRLIIDDGWTENNGKVSLGASEKIETSDGKTVLDEKDLFQDIGPVNADDAKVVSLTAEISRLDKLYDYFVVSFRVWDKNGDGEITGSYKLYLK